MAHNLPDCPPDPAPCPHCGCLDIPCFEGEVPICPHCGAILLSPPPPPSWLEQWPREKRSTVANWFYQAVRSGLTDPPAIGAHVAMELQRRLAWTVDSDRRTFLTEVLTALRRDRAAAEAYAATVLAREQLPWAEKEALTREKARPYLLEAMKGRPVTDKQLWLLKSKGYVGPLPEDRAEASLLIDQLLQPKGGAR